MPPPRVKIRFDMRNFQNETASGVHAPLKVHALLREILDPPLHVMHTFVIHGRRYHYKHLEIEEFCVLLFFKFH